MFSYGACRLVAGSRPALAEQVVAEHLLSVAVLPQLHNDPFDRLLIAQAQHERMAIVTADEHIEKYEIRTIW